MNKCGKKCVLYPRVSTEMQVDGFSLDGQKSSLNRYADREEMIVVGMYEDAGKSVNQLKVDRLLNKCFLTFKMVCR